MVILKFDRREMLQHMVTKKATNSPSGTAA